MSNVLTALVNAPIRTRPTGSRRADDFGPRRVHLVQDDPGVSYERDARLSESQPAAGVFEQFGVDLALQDRELLRTAGRAEPGGHGDGDGRRSNSPAGSAAAAAMDPARTAAHCSVLPKRMGENKCWSQTASARTVEA